MSEKAVMGFVGISEEDAVVDLPSYPAFGTDRGGPVDLGGHLDLRSFAQCEWSADHCTLHDLSILADIDRTGSCIKRGSFYYRSLFNENLAVTDYPVRFADGL